MANIEKRTISLPSEQAAFIESKVRSGDYASVSEVVRAGIRALRERDAVIERWLQNDVGVSYDAMKSNPSRAVSVDAVLDSIRLLHVERKKELK